MSYRNKTYVAFDADTDIHYYRLMTAWKENENIDFNFHNAHDLNNLMSYSSEETIKRKLRERLNNTKSFILLIGEHTKNLYKFVRWEIQTAIDLDIPIICANLNGNEDFDYEHCPPILRNHTALHVSFGVKPIKEALDVWTNDLIAELISEGKEGPIYFKEHVYREFES